MPSNANFQGLTFDEAVDNARIVAEAAAKHGTTMRLLGALAINIRSLAANKTYEFFIKDRIKGFENPFTDLDFISLSKHRDGVAKVLKELGYEPRGRFTAIEFDRIIYRHPTKGFVIDVFLDTLSMCHTIDFRNRLSFDDLTATPTDLLLTKMQIVNISEKDVKDSITLLIDHQIRRDDEKGINSAYIARLLSNDWGFYYTVTTNLRKIRTDFEHLYQNVIPGSLIQDLHGKTDQLLLNIENAPKSFGWRMRAKVGPKKKWYQEVDSQG